MSLAPISSWQVVRLSRLLLFQCIRTRVVTLIAIKKLFKLVANVKLLSESNSELIKGSLGLSRVRESGGVVSGPSSLTDIISAVYQTLDAFVRARDLLSLFSEVLLTDLLPLSSQLLGSSSIVEFPLLALCILNELLTLIKLPDGILSEPLRQDLHQELQLNFLPLICDRHLLREEPIAVLSVRFIQNLVASIEPTSTVVSSTLSQSKLIPNLFALILVREAEPKKNSLRLRFSFSKTKTNLREHSFRVWCPV